jgi:hypothetical protein
MPLRGEPSPHPVAEVALQFDSAITHGTAAAAGTFELLQQLFEELIVPRQAINHGHGLAATASLHDP